MTLLSCDVSCVWQIAVGAPLYKIDSSGSPASPANPSTAKAENVAVPPSAAAVAPVPADVPVAPKAVHEVLVPTMGESITQGVLAKWMVKPGQSVPLDAVVATIETDKVRGRGRRGSRE